MAELKRVVKLQIKAGLANPAPPIGTVLGPTGIAIQEFCKQFNDQTRDRSGLVIPAVISIFDDRSFTFILKEPPAGVLIKKELGIERGSAKPNSEKIATMSRAQLENVAKAKMPDLNTDDLDAAVKIIAGTAMQMGIKVEL